MSRAVMQQALGALVTCCAEEWRTLNNFGMRQVYDEKKVNAAIAALHAALLADVTPAQMAHADAVAKPQTTHWEGCEAVHPECRKPEQEPVAWMDIDDKGQRHGLRYYSDGSSDEVPLYTSAPTPQQPEQDTDCHQSGICQRSGYSIAPTPHKPLTDGQIDELSRTMVKGDKSVNWLCRAIEAAHGITGEQT